MESDETHPESFSTRRRQRPTEELPSPPPDGLEKRRLKRQSLRVRPPILLDNAEPPTPLKAPSVRSASSKSSKMSLFHIFGRPKVEKQRGYAERGLEVPPPLPTNASKANLLVQVQSNDDPPMAPSTLSMRNTGPKSFSKSKVKETPPPPREHKTGPFEPPPLFQAFPQSTKDGALEVCAMSAETVLQKTKSRKAGGLQIPAPNSAGRPEDAMTVDTWRTKTTFMHVAGGSTAHIELPKKIFVLVTSGYLLQYAENGPSNRLPEKMLHLGKDSAAFACDLLPGKHYVLQVSQAVDEQGVIVANSGSIFSKLGIRSAAAKRMSTNLLLVMPNGAEMESWMMAIRREIEALGGTKVRPDSAVRPKTGDASAKTVDLKKTPSASHRYQVKRNPSKVSLVTSSNDEVPALPLGSPNGVVSKAENKDKSDADTIDGIEIEAAKLDDEEVAPVTRKRSPSDAPSLSSSTAVSVEQHQLNNLRSSLSNKRTSRASVAPTVATTAATSRTNSLTGSPPPSDQSLAGSLDSTRDSVLSKTNYRTLASYTLSRRRSALPLPPTREVKTPEILNTSPPKTRTSTFGPTTESPVVGRNSPLPPTSPQKRLTAARSEPNLNNREKHDSKMPTPLLPQAGEGRPESFVGDLPPPSTWSSSRSPSRRTSIIQPAATQAPPTQQAPAHTRTPDLHRPKRMSTFSLPLKVNPSGQQAQNALPSRRVSQIHDPESAGESPVVHTLTAKIDPPMSPTQTTRPLEVPQRSSSQSPSARLSLFPIQTSSSPPLPSPDSPRRSPSVAQPSRMQAQTNARTLRRPTSVQVRSDPAPFLSSVRNSAGPSTTLAPIRGVKPSRSAGNVPALAQPSPTDPFRGLRFDNNNPMFSEEDSDKATPLPSRNASPFQTPGSRMSLRKGLKARSSLPELDLGIPVVGLGPPAPPPSAPLPPPPPNSTPSSRAASPTPMYTANAGIDAVAGLGIRVS